MSSSRPWLTYSLLRIGLFAVVFAFLALTGVNPILAAVIAAIVGLCVTYIFFRRQRDQVATSFYRWRTSSKPDRDGVAEDDLLDGSGGADAGGAGAGGAGAGGAGAGGAGAFNASPVSAGDRHPASEVPPESSPYQRPRFSEGERDR